MGVVQYFCVSCAFSRLKVSVPHLRQIAPFALKNSVFVPLVSFCEEISGKTSAPPNFSGLEILCLHTCSISGSKLLRLFSRLKVSVPHLRQIAPFAVKNSVFVPLVSFCEEISG